MNHRCYNCGMTLLENEVRYNDIQREECCNLCWIKLEIACK